MLFYERSEELEPCRQPRPQPTPPEQPSAAAGATGTAASANPMLNTQSSSGGAATQQATTAAAGAPLAAPSAGGTGGGMPPAVLPSLFADVMEENLALAERIHLLDADYLRCLGATQFRMPLGAPDLWRACANRTSCRWTRPRC